MKITLSVIQSPLRVVHGSKVIQNMETKKITPLTCNAAVYLARNDVAEHSLIALPQSLRLPQTLNMKGFGDVLVL